MKISNLLQTTTILVFFGFLASTSTLRAQNREESRFKVQGNCEMCKERIETALDVKGMVVADWDVHTKELFVVYNPKKIKLSDIHKLVQNAGHDTDCGLAPAEAYAKVHGCCKYREEPEEVGHKGHGHD